MKGVYVDAGEREDTVNGGAGAGACNGGNGSDAAAESDEDAYHSVETMLTLTA